MDLAEARRQFRPEPGWLDTASYGLPPDAGWDALQTALADWRVGHTSWKPWGSATTEARDTFARLVRARAEDVSVGAQASQMLAPLASSIPDDATVLIPQEEFTSNVFPWLVQEARGVKVRTAPAAVLADAVDASTSVVAFSLVQSATGEIADVDAVVDAARAVGALTVADASQAAGWLPVDAARVDALVCVAYKWLLSPRGTGFLVTTPELRERIVPSQAGWYAGEDVHNSYYGPPLRLAADARRLDLSPAWLSWVGTAPALALLEQVGIEAVHAHDVGLADRFRAGLGLEPGTSAIVSVNIDGAADKLAAAGIRASVRGGSLRTSFHLYTTEDDVDTALNALTG